MDNAAFRVSKLLKAVFLLAGFVPLSPVRSCQWIG